MVDNNENRRSDVEEPWRVSPKGAVWCKWQHVPNGIRSHLKMDNGFAKTIDSYSYRVKRNEAESYIVFRNTPRNHRDASTKRPEHRVSGIQILPIEEANKLLASNQFELVGIDPIKVIDQQFFVALVCAGHA